MALTPQREALLNEVAPPDNTTPQALEVRKTFTDGDENAVFTLSADAFKAVKQAAKDARDRAAQLEAEKAELEGQLETAENAKEQALALSASSAPRQPDPVVSAMYADNIAAKREAAVASGAVSEAQAKLFDELVSDASGAPTALALSATGPARRPFGFELWDRLAKLAGGGVRANNGVPRGVTAATMQLSDDNSASEQENAGVQLAEEYNARIEAMAAK